MYSEKSELSKTDVLTAVAEMEDPYQNLLQFYNQLVKLAKGCIKDGPKGTPQAKLKFVNIKDKQLDMSALERA